MNRLEQLAQRLGKRYAQENKQEKITCRERIKSLEKMARLFRACGDLCEVQAIQLKKK